MNKKRWRYLPVTLWTIVIIILSTSSGVQAPFGFDEVLGIDKVGHLISYCLHTVLLAWAIVPNENPKIKKKYILLAFLGSAILGIVMEIVQYSFYPNRYFEIFDIIANIIGSLIGIAIFKRLLIINH